MCLPVASEVVEDVVTKWRFFIIKSTGSDYYWTKLPPAYFNTHLQVI